MKGYKFLGLKIMGFLLGGLNSKTYSQTHANVVIFRGHGYFIREYKSVSKCPIQGIDRIPDGPCL